MAPVDRKVIIYGFIEEEGFLNDTRGGGESAHFNRATIFSQGGGEGEDGFGVTEVDAVGCGDGEAGTFVGYLEGEEVGDFEACTEEGDVVETAESVGFAGEVEGTEAGELGLMVGNTSFGLAWATTGLFTIGDIWNDGVDIGIQTLGSGLTEDLAEGEKIEALVGLGEGCVLAEAVGVCSKEIDKAGSPAGYGCEEDVDIAFGEVGKDGAQRPEPFGVDGFEKDAVDELQ